VSRTLLLDTHVLLWWLSDRERLSRAQARVLAKVAPDAPAGVASISLWEVATLHARGRVGLDLPLRDWLEKAVAPPLVRVLPLTPAVAAETAALPWSAPRDPADRILIATARVHGLTLLTSDSAILDARLVPMVG